MARKPQAHDGDYYRRRAAEIRAEVAGPEPAKASPRPRRDKREAPAGLHIPDGLMEVLAKWGGANPTRASSPHLNPFSIQSFHPDSVLPPKRLRAHEQMAQDDAMTWAVNDWNAGGFLHQAGAQGLIFPGYPFLSELAIRAEYDTASDVIATEMTRKWIKLKGKSAKKGKPDGKADKIQELEAYMELLNVRGAYKTWAKHDGLFGRAHIFHEIGDNNARDGSGTREVQELKVPITKGHKIDKQMVNPEHPLTRLTNIEPVWVYPTTYNANNPLAPNFYNPQIWYTIGGREIHATRMPCLIGHPVPDLLKPAYSFGGISLSQLMMPYVEIWLETRQAIGRLIKGFSTPVLQTVLQNLMAPGGGQLLTRAALFNNVRDNMGLFLLDKATEDFKIESVSLASLDALQAQSQEHVCAVNRIPTAIYTGLSPTGLNASSEGEIRIFENTIHAYQEARFRRPLTFTIHLCMMSLWGEVDEDIVFDFVPLREMTEKETAEINKMKAETDDLLMNGTQAIGPQEIRTRIAGDADSGYDNIDPEEEPELPEPDPMAMGGEGGGGKLNLTGHERAGMGGPAPPKPNGEAKPPAKAKTAQDVAQG